MYWNCRGFPWHKGVSTNALFGDVDVIFLGETWEREECKLPNIPGYIVFSMFQSHTELRGQGGVACIFKECL